ncbi:MAG: hypothetical protein KKA42_15110, partial [candidate division Zixibacteria bacterium]|nr:hypothetical protein [candidate division Zixibacteria bacterium]
EDLLTMSGGGAISVIAATRLVYAGANAQFNRVVYDIMLQDQSLSMCEALFAAKVIRQYPGPTPTSNDRAYTYFGGPFVKLAIPEHRTEFTERPDSLVALGLTRVSGHIVDADGAPIVQNGTLYVEAFDSDRHKVYRLEGSTDTALAYDLPGPSLYRGAVSVTGGEFTVEFMTPLDIGYGGSNARISLYADLEAGDAIGLVDSIPVSGTLETVADSIGPIVDYGILGHDSFVSGDVVAISETLEISLTDSSGINLSDGLGHGITLTLDGDAEGAQNLTGLFEYDPDNFMTGRLLFPLSELEVGTHTVKVKAWDNANNMGSVEFSIEIVEAGHFQISELLNYPNPMSDATTFYFGLTQPVSGLTLEIFTLSGRSIWKTSHANLAADQYPNSNLQIVWTGRDSAGDRVATGVYIYKASASPYSGGEAFEQFGKLVVVN